MTSINSFSVDGHCFEISECGLDADADIDLADAEHLISADECKRADAFVFMRDRDRFVRSRGFLRKRLGLRLGLDPKSVEIGEHSRGKPYVRGGGVNFNVSHSGGFLVVVVTKGPEVGIDLEVEDHDGSLGAELIDLADACLTDTEHAELFSTPISERTRRFLTYWTAKEARMKLYGEGFALEPKAVALDLEDGFPVGYLRPPTPNLQLRFVELCAPSAVCCVAFSL